jgi:hypothetical protein
MNALVFDIETGPEVGEVLSEMEPEFTAPANFKDPVKIAEKVEGQRVAWRDRAALCATTGRVLAIGTMLDGDVQLLAVDEGEPFLEADLLDAFWRLAAPQGSWRHLIGFNSNRFDIPFLIRRSYKLGVNVPYGALNGRYLNPRFVDLMDTWKLGDFQASISLDRLAKHLGVGAKNGDGARFAALLEEDRAAALDYLRNDIEMTVAVARKLGVLAPLSKELAY